MTGDGIVGDLSGIVGRLRGLQAAVAGAPVLRWATVVQSHPLRVRLYGDADALDGVPATVLPVLIPGERVVCVRQNLRATVIAVAGRVGDIRLTAAEMAALALTGVVPEGMRVYGVDDGREYVWLSGAWVAPAAYGMQGQIPSSVAVGSGTASVALDGTVTFTGASSVSLNGVFTGEHDVYEATILLTNSVAGGGVWNRMRAGGVDYSGATYNYVAHYTAVASGPNRYSFFGGTAAPTLNPGLGASTPLIRSKITYFSPARSEAIVQMMAEHVVAASDRYMCFEAADVGGSPYDGFTIASGGTMSGRIKVVKIG